MFLLCAHHHCCGASSSSSSNMCSHLQQQQVGLCRWSALLLLKWQLWCIQQQQQ
jgi:hypothetical protein